MKKIPGRIREFEIFKNGQEADVSVTPLEIGDELQTYRISIDFPEKVVPGKIKLRWVEPFVDILSTWTPTTGFNRGLYSDWRPLSTTSRSAAGAPILSLIGAGGNNSCTFALADAATPVYLSAGISDQLRDVICVIELFINRVDLMDHYETVLRIDSREIPYYDSIKAVRDWWSNGAYPQAHVPVSAKRAMFSSWYNFQKRITTDTVLAQCKLAKEYGLDTIILDDGWQTAESASGYSYCGDWECVESKIPSMKELVAQVHALGMKFMLWYSVPFVGVHAKCFKRFEGMYLRSRNNGDVGILDPRFPEVRKYLVETYETAVREWKLDGLKLDFIDSFGLSEESPTNYEDMDCPSLEAAVEKLLNEVTTALRAIDPEILIEFRQSYIGPVMQKYGNILRVGDCGGGATINRVHATDLRLLTNNGTAVHSDMLVWNYEAPVETAADQMINIMYCVPQISVFFDQLPEDHQKMLKYYLKFMDDNRHILIDGELVPLGVEASYSQIYARIEGEIIATVYSNPVFVMKEKLNRLVIANGTGNTDVYIDNKCSDAKYSFEIRNCMGDIVSSGEATLANGISKFDVPVNGFLFLNTVK